MVHANTTGDITGLHFVKCSDKQLYVDCGHELPDDDEQQCLMGWIPCYLIADLLYW